MTHCPYRNCEFTVSLPVDWKLTQLAEETKDLTNRLIVIHVWQNHLDQITEDVGTCWCGDTWNVSEPFAFYSPSDIEGRKLIENRIFDQLTRHMNDNGGIHHHYRSWHAENALL
jgi:hypothetical protein